MKKITLLIIISLSFSMKAQQCIVKYAVVPTFGSIENISEENKNNENAIFLKKFLEGADETLKGLEYKLIVNGQISFFKLDKENYTPGFKKNIYAINAATKSYFFTKSDSVFRVPNLLGDKIVLSSKSMNNWILSKEVKIIDNNICYKATIERPWKSLPETNNNKSTYIVTAWYCPKIPIKYGPKGFGNLPGLILELQDNKVTFLAKNIQLNVSEEINLQEYEKYKHPTEEKYQEKLNEIKSSFLKPKD